MTLLAPLLLVAPVAAQPAVAHTALAGTPPRAQDMGGQACDEGGIGWYREGWEALLAEAARSNRIVFVEFRAEWCETCDKLEETTYRDGNVLAELGDVLCFRVDVQSRTGRPIAKEFRVKSYPTLLFLDPDASPRDRLHGYFDPGEFAAEVRRIKRDEGTIGAIRRRIEENPADVEARYELAVKLRDMGDEPGFREQTDEIARLDPQGETLPSRKLKLDRTLAELRQSMDLAPLRELLGKETDPGILFTGWYEVWKCEGNLMAGAADDAARVGHRERWIEAARGMWEHVPEDKVGRYGNYVAWSLYEHRSLLTPDDLLFALRVAEDAARDAPDHAAVIDTLACCQFAVGRVEEALSNVRRCIQMEPKNPEWRRRLEEFMAPH